VIGEQVSQAYGLPVVRVEFLPLGADANTAVYRLTSREGERYFLKLRIANFDQLTVELPGWLHTQGIRQVMAPLQTKAGGLWSKLNEYTAILYPYLEGQNACDSPLSEAQWIEFGKALRAFHDTCRRI
jgi:spectinomycin phosphotransferase